eukprot:984714-Rhodomonas_salina.4
MHYATSGAELSDFQCYWPRLCSYGISGTDRGYAPTSPTMTRYDGLLVGPGQLRYYQSAWYKMFGTDVAYDVCAV